MARSRSAAAGAGLARWLLPASVLHAALVALGAALAPWGGSRPAPAAGVPGAPESDASSELSLLDDVAGPVDVPAPALRIPLRAERVTGQRRPDAARGAASPLTPAPPAGVESPREPAPASSLNPSLSLDQLGVGANPFLDVAIPPLTREEQANARLYAALHPPAAERLRGPAGPVADAARGLLLADDLLAETNAVFNVSVDGSGHITEVHVLDASSQVQAWQMIAARLAKALRPVKLPAGSQQGWAMKLRLASTVQLPSGAAPGMRAGVLGKQVAGSGGRDSTSLELSPTAKLDLKDPIDNIGRHLEAPMRFEVMLLKLKADPTDIGAAARRVVEVAVLSIDPPASR